MTRLMMIWIDMIMLHSKNIFCNLTDDIIEEHDE